MYQRYTLREEGVPYDFWQMIAEQIDDSLTWCRFSQICRRANHVTKILIIPARETKKIDGSEYSNVLQFNRLPSGVIHGEYKLSIYHHISPGKADLIGCETGYHKDGFVMPIELLGESSDKI